MSKKLIIFVWIVVIAIIIINPEFRSDERVLTDQLKERYRKSLATAKYLEHFENEN